MKLGIITGVTGQDGSYLVELLLEKNYTVWGVVRTSSSSVYERIHHITSNPFFILKKGDLRDTYSLQTIFNDIDPTAFEAIEIYNLAAQSHVRHSFDMPEYTADVDALGVLRLLECMRRCPFKDKIRFYQASTSELYGNRIQENQSVRILDETSGFEPCSPYAVSKLFAFWSVRNYREGYNLFACNGILFNHESPRRGIEFVTRKITTTLAKIKRGELTTLELGNLDARRDWGHARDYVEGMWRILQVSEPDDWVLATGENHSVREFVEEAFRLVNLPIQWQGKGVEEVGMDEAGIVRVKINPAFYRPNELHTLLGNAERSEKELGWKPKTSFKDLVREMVEYDLDTTT
jgi:GDPmannose 4,6-dehydratase